uniref:Uncharacterized protein n=1 Tax=Arundo donax TaxID=35708 RepID=A0A0A8YVL4_ARUDO
MIHIYMGINVKIWQSYGHNHTRGW